MLVYRLENSKGQGPFINDPDAAAMVAAMGWGSVVPSEQAIVPDDTHPHHFADIPDSTDTAVDLLMVKLGLPPIWKCGVQSVQLFLHWFPLRSFDYFASHGFHVVEYSVPENAVRLGTYQCLFETEQAQVSKTESLQSFREECAHV